MGKEYKKTGIGWFNTKHQFPNPRVEIYTSGNSSQADLIYDGLAKDGLQSKLLGYTFSEGVDSLDGPFSITVENEKIGTNGKTTFDAIPKRSIVKIYEADKKHPAFIGIVKNRRIRNAMTSNGPKRTIMFYGKNIMSAITEFAVTTDFRISFMDPTTETKQLTEKLSQSELSIKTFLIATWEAFLKQGESNSAVSSTALKKIITDFIGSGDSFISTGTEKSLYYNITGSFYSEGNNTINQLWRNILPQPVYELYAYCDRETGKPMIMSREAPFGFPDTNNTDWADLDIYEIDPVDLIDYDLNQSDEEVYNVFMAYLIGSAMSNDFYLGADQAKGSDILAKDEDKLALYGYRPLQMSFRGYDRQGAGTDTLNNVFKELNQKAKYWYGRLDDMFSGPITVITDFVEPKNNDSDRNPRIGCRVRFMGGEFYINKADHKWTYGGTPTITLALSRGMKYDDSGYQVSGDNGVLSDIGKQFKELE